MRQLSRRSKILMSAALILAVGMGTAEGLAPYLMMTENFTVGANLQVSGLSVDYNSGTSSACAASTFPSWTCPVPSGIQNGKIFAGDIINHYFWSETDRSTQSPSLTVTAGTFSAFSLSIKSDPVSGPGVFAGAWTNGLPSMTSGQWYQIQYNITITAAAPTGVVTFSTSFGV